MKLDMSCEAFRNLNVGKISFYLTRADRGDRDSWLDSSDESSQILYGNQNNDARYL